MEVAAAEPVKKADRKSKKKAENPATSVASEEKGSAIKAAIVAPAGVISFRRATARDLTQLYDCLLHYFDELSFAYPGVNETDVVTWGLGVVNGGGCIVAECDGKIIGSVGMEVSTFPWNRANRYLNSVWLFVVPEFRKGGTGIRLMKLAKDIAKSNEMPVMLGEVFGFEPELLGKIKQVLGFKHVGGNYIWIP
jgi:GNAT superfamily N-acetyltransferase